MPGAAAALNSTDCRVAFWWSPAIGTCSDRDISTSVENGKCRLRAECRTNRWTPSDWRDDDYHPDDYFANDVLYNYQDMKNLVNCDGKLQLHSC